MIQRIGYYLHLYSGFISTSFTEAMGFRVHFFLLIIMDLIFYITALASITIIFMHVETIGVWKKEQFLFFTSVMLAINQLTMTFVSESFWRFSILIRSGNLDFILIRPANAIFSSFFRIIRPGSMINILFTGSAVIYFGIQVHLSTLSWFLLPLFILLGFLLQNAIELVISCSMFWMLEGTGINFLRIEMQQLSRWPDFIYNSIVRRILTLIIPLLLVGSAPVRFLFNPSDWKPLAGMVLAIFVLIGLLRFSWNAGLRNYESASS